VTAIPIERSDSHQSGDLLVREHNEIGELRNDGGGQHRPNPRYASPERDFVTPEGAGADGLVQIVFDSSDWDLKPSQVLVDLPTSQSRRPATTIALGGDHPK
jgi:hypothetical protein